jgi:hypothetical protein
MDASRIDELSRRVGAAASRRGAVAAAVTLAAPVLVHFGWQPARANIPIFKCKEPGKRCRSDQQCCSTRCKNKLCRCSRKGRPCWDPLEGALCCSQRCNDGKCQ